MRLRLVVLISGEGTLLQSILDACASGVLAADVVAVCADRADVYGLQRATEANVPTRVHPFRRGQDRARWDVELAEIVGEFSPDLVVSAGFMKLLGEAFLERFGGRTINTHPALLPSFPGMHGPRDALAYGVKVSGATVFLVDEGTDTGQILAQRAVPVLSGDDEASLHERIKVAERELLLQTVADWAAAQPQRSTPEKTNEDKDHSYE